jgi:hypothetical protein
LLLRAEQAPNTKNTMQAKFQMEPKSGRKNAAFPNTPDRLRSVFATAEGRFVQIVDGVMLNLAYLLE